MKIAVITDSAADLPPATANAADIRVIPLSVSFGERSFQAGVDLSTDEFWRLMTAPDAPFPTTAAASPGAATARAAGTGHWLRSSGHR